MKIKILVFGINYKKCYNINKLNYGVSQMDILFLGYSKCSNSQRAKKWLDEHGVKYQERDIKEQRPTRQELEKWHNMSNLPLKHFFNTSGNIYRELNLKEKLPQMDELQQLELLATDGMLVKRPIVVAQDFVLVGFKEIQWEQKLI